MINFAASVVFFLIVNVLSFLAWGVIFWLGHGGGRALGITGDTPNGILALVWWTIGVINAGISAILLFSFGRKLNLLDKHWLNYLSVSGNLIIPAILSAVFLDFSILLWATPPSIMLLEMTRPSGAEAYYSIAFVGIVAILPPTFTWVGMLYQLWKEQTQALTAQLDMDCREDDA